MSHTDGREYAQLKLSIWTNEHWLALSVGAKMLYLRIESERELSHVGVLDWRPAKLSVSLDPHWTRVEVEAAADELEAARFIVVDHATEEVLIRSHVRHDKSMTTWQRALGVRKAYERVASPTLKQAVKAELTRLRNDHPEYNTWVHKVTREWFADLLSIPYPHTVSDTVSHTVSHTVSKPAPHTVSDTVWGQPSNQLNRTTTDLDQQADRESEKLIDEDPALVEVTSGRRVRVRKAEVDELFDDFWKIYPRRVGKQLAWRSFNTRLQSGIDPVLILEAAQKVADTLASGKVEMRFVPHPSTWLLRHGWEDETEGVTPEPPTETKTAFQRQIDQQREFMRVQDLSMLR